MSTATNERLRPQNGSATAQWTAADAAELYEVARWGQGYFSVNDAGHMQVHPTRDAARSVDLKKLVDRLELRGLSAPILVRFPDILQHRLGEIHSAFQNAITQNQYQGRYVCVYPIKVNQQRQVVQEVMDFGRQYGFGLEAGSPSPSCWPWPPWPPTTRRSSATGSRTPSSSRWRCWPRRSAATSSRWSRSTPSSS